MSLVLFPVTRVSSPLAPRCLADCGNGVCERGEECTAASCSGGCISDCAVFVTSCPFGLNRYGSASVCSSNGVCQQGTGRCACFAGYTGEVCSACTSEYIQVTRGGACIYLPGALSSCEDGVRNGNEVDVDCGGENCQPCSQTSRFTLIVAIIGAVSVVCVTVVAVIYLRRWYRHRKSSVVPSAITPGAKHTKLANTKTRRILLGQQRSPVRRSSAVTPSITIAWQTYERRQPKAGALARFPA
jgi:hypothetical protein